MKRVLLIEDLPQVAEHLKGMLAREKDVEIAGVQGQADAGIAQASTEKPDVVLVDALLQGKTTGFDVAKRVRAASPGTRIIVVTVPQRPVDPRPDQGIDAVFVLPGGANELAAALGGGRDVRREGGGDVIAVYSPKGGTGKTTIAVNLACVLRRNGASVALFDGIMQFGAVRHLLPVPPATRSIVDLPAGAAMRASLAEAVWEGPGGIDVLLAPPRPEEADLVAASELSNAIGLLATNHDYVIVDTPSRLSEDALAILDAASMILIIITYQGATIANTRSAIDTFEALGYKGQKPLLLVVNQSDLTAGLSKGGMEHALNLPVIGEIPSDWKLISESNNKQAPFVLSHANAPASQAVANLANALVSQQRKR
ncbi:MAG: pilus assembly protein CpaE [Chloroflexota bacterium]|nr:pilus assembly protein CpaE [Chloroflexota bacterium]